MNARSSGNAASTRSSSPFVNDRITSLRPTLELRWDLAVLDRLQAPLTHYHD